MSEERREALSEESSLRAYEIPVILVTAEAAAEVAALLRAEGAAISYESPVNSIRLAYPVKKRDRGFSVSSSCAFRPPASLR